jgi:hypothetical protein
MRNNRLLADHNRGHHPRAPPPSLATPAEAPRTLGCLARPAQAWHANHRFAIKCPSRELFSGR